jgi:hypothetical protein
LLASGVSSLSNSVRDSSSSLTLEGSPSSNIQCLPGEGLEFKGRGELC